MSLRPPVTMKMAFKPERFRKTFQVYFQRRDAIFGTDGIFPELVSSRCLKSDIKNFVFSETKNQKSPLNKYRNRNFHQNKQ